MSRNRLISFSILGLFLLVVVATLILTSYYEKLPENIVPQETIILGQNRMVPGSQAALRVVVRDARDSSPLPQAEIRVSMKPTGGGISKEVYRGRTDTQGTAEVVFKVPEDVDPNQTLVVETNSNLGSYTVERPITLERDYRLLLTTDKPIYQPGQVIHLRALVLSTFDLKPAANNSLEIVIADGKGNKVFRKTLTTSEFGIAAADFQLAAEVNTGQYKISATYVGGNSTPAGVTSEKTVNVEHYVLPKFSVKLENDRTYYRPGQHVQGMLQADYFFGKPVAGAEVLIEGYTFDVERVVTVSLKGQTDEKGKYEYFINLPDYVAGTDLEGGLGRYYIQASVTDLIKHTETSNLSLPVASSALIIEAVPEGGLIRTGLENILYVLTSYPDGSPAETNFEIQFVENSQNTQVKTGAYGLAEVRFTPRDPYQTITINAWDASGNMALRQFSFEGDYSEETVLLRPDRPVYRVGETMNLTIFTSAQQGTVYLDIVREGQTVSTRSVQVNAGKAEIAVDLTPDLFGSLELHAYKILSWGGITRDTRLVVVDNAADLNINLTPQCAENSSSNSETSCVYRPGDTANVDVQVKDQNGSGIRSALGIAIVDESVFAMAEQDPGFAKLYFLLENELLKPKYELHDLSLLDLILSPQKDQFEGKAELEKAVNEAAKASLAAVSPQTPGFSLQVNSHEEAMQKASEQQRGFYTNLSKVLYWLILLLSVMIISLSGYALWRKKRLGRSLALAIGLFIAFFLLLMIIPQGFDWYQISEWLFYEAESVLIALGLLALIGYFALVVIAWRQKDRLLGWTLGLSLVFIGTVILLVNISSRGSYYPDGLVVDLMALTLAFLPLTYMLRLADFIFERQILQFLCTIPLILVLLVGFLPIIGMVNSNLLPGIAPANLLRGESALLMEKDFAQFEAAQPMAAPMATAMPVAEEVLGNKGTASGAVAQEPPRLRQYFPETMLWLPEVVTDEKGYLKMDVPVADSITTWRMTALASTQDGRLGSTTGALRVFQDFFIDLDLPQNLTVGDEVSVPVGVFNYLIEPQTVRLELEQAGWFDLLEESNVKEITIASNDITVVYFRVRAKDFGLQPFKITAWGTRISDAIQKQVHVFPDGKQIQFAQSDRLTLEAPIRQAVNIPTDAIPGTQKFIVKIYPGVISQVVEGLDSILQMPSGCFEQTSSTTYPDIMVLDYLKTTNQASPEVQFKAEDYINLGYQRLITFEVGNSGGFSLFGDEPADPMLTAYGLQEFNDMSRVQDVDPALIQRTADWLLGHQNGDGSWQGLNGFHETGLTNLVERLPVTGYVVWGLCDAGFCRESGAQKGIQYLREFQAQAEDPYQLALVANALVAADRSGDQGISSATMAVIERLAGMAKWDANSVSWPSKVNTVMGSYGEVGTLETTALAALAFLHAENHPELANAALTYLVKSKDNLGTWETTQATVMALKALLESVRSGAENVNATVTVILNDGQAQTVQVTQENFDVVQLLAFDNVNIGKENVIEIVATGKGNLMYQAAGNYYLPWEMLSKYPKLVEQKDLVTIEVVYDRAELTMNDTVNVDVTISLREAGMKADSAIIDLGLPPGFTVEIEDLSALVAHFKDVPEDFASAKIERYELTGRQIIVYISNLNAENPLKFSYRLRAKFPISAKTPGSSVYDYYNPNVSGEAAPQRLFVAPSGSIQPRNQTPTLSGSPRDWLPGENKLIPSALLMFEGSFSNEELAPQYPDPAEALANFKKWGRITSTIQLYSHKDACEAKDGLRWVKVQAVVYDTADGAQKGLDWSNTMINAELIDQTKLVGENGITAWWNGQSDCYPPEAIRSIRIAFRRYNVIGIVDVGSVTELADESQMQTLATALAQLIDEKLLAAAK